DEAVLEAFETVQLPVPEANMNPDFTECSFIDYPVDFYVTAPNTDPITVTVLGTEVILYPEITGYTWDLGDGTTITTDQPTTPAGLIEHTYTETGIYQVTV